MLGWIKKEYPHLVATASGLAMVAVAFVQNTGGVHTAVLGGGGVVLALGATVAKLFADKGVNVATIENAGSDVAAQLPGLKADLASVKSFVETEWPTSKNILVDLGARLTAVEQKALAVPGLDTIVSAVRQAIAGAPAPVATVQSSAPPAPPAAATA